MYSSIRGVPQEFQVFGKPGIPLEFLGIPNWSGIPEYREYQNTSGYSREYLNFRPKPACTLYICTYICRFFFDYLGNIKYGICFLDIRRLSVRVSTKDQGPRTVLVFPIRNSWNSRFPGIPQEFLTSDMVFPGMAHL